MEEVRGQREGERVGEEDQYLVPVADDYTIYRKRDWDLMCFNFIL